MATKTESTATLDRSVRHQLRARGIDQTFTIDVARPQEEPHGPMPVIYTLDGNMMFALVAQTVRLLQMGQELPPALVVGIGYKETTPATIMALRCRDLTPSVDQDFIGRSGSMGIEITPDIQLGGAAAFFDFIQNEVRPLIESNYDVTDDATLVGDSLGGLFTLHTMFSHPLSFQHYLAGSPSLWWDKKKLLEVEGIAQSQHPPESFSVDLFLSVGADEENDPATAGWSQMVTNTQTLIERLQSPHYEQLRLTHHQFADESHVSVIPATFSRGLRALFAVDGA